MKTQDLHLEIHFPEPEDFLKTYPHYRKFLAGPGDELFAEIMRPGVYLQAKAAADFGYPSAWAAAELTSRFMDKHGISHQDRTTKTCVGAVICALMTANGYRKTGVKKSVPHPAISTAEVYTAHATPPTA